MTKHNLEETARTLVDAGKGILAADESVPTITKRFASLGQYDESMERDTADVAMASHRARWSDD